MKRYLLDSNALNLFIYRRKNVYVRAMALKQTGAMIGTGIPIVAEILGGTLASGSWEANLPLVELKLQTLRLWPFDLAAAREYARLFAELKRGGIRM